MSRRNPGSGAGASPVVQLDLFAEQDQADAAAAAELQAAALLVDGGVEVIDTVALARLCRVEVEALDARDRDDRERFGRGGCSDGYFAEEARRVRVIAGWLDERGTHHGGRVPRAGVGWPCSRCDVAPGVMCGTRQHGGQRDGRGDGQGDGQAFIHCGRGFRIGFTSPGAGSTSSEDPGPEANPTAGAGCAPTCEDGPGGAWRGRCLGCGWRGRIRGRETGGENRAVEDAHDHTHPGWRDLPLIDPQPNTGGDNPRAQSRADQRWTAAAHAAAPAGVVRQRRTRADPARAAREPARPRPRPRRRLRPRRGVGPDRYTAPRRRPERRPGRRREGGAGSMGTVSGEPEQRPAQPGELCTCGREALVVYLQGRFGAVGHCGFDDGGLPASGVCTFCGDRVDHDYFWDSERDAGRADMVGTGSGAQGAPCPLYRLRLADPLPQLHETSVRPFDPDAHRHERAQARLTNEVLEVLIAAGADYYGTYTLLPDEPGQPGDTGDLEDVAFDLVWFVRQALDRDDYDTSKGSRHPDAGQEAVAVLVTMLRDRLDELGTDPNPLAGWFDAVTLVERAGGPDVWADTVAHDRPLLVARRVARRALDPDVPPDIYRTWAT